MWENAVGQAEGGAQVAFHLGCFLDEWQELSVHSFLVLLPLLCQLVLLQMVQGNCRKVRHTLRWDTAHSFIVREDGLFTSFSVSKISPSW